MKKLALVLLFLAGCGQTQSPPYTQLHGDWAFSPTSWVFLAGNQFTYQKCPLATQPYACYNGAGGCAVVGTWTDLNPGSSSGYMSITVSPLSTCPAPTGTVVEPYTISNGVLNLGGFQ